MVLEPWPTKEGGHPAGMSAVSGISDSFVPAWPRVGVGLLPSSPSGIQRVLQLTQEGPPQASLRCSQHNLWHSGNLPLQRLLKSHTFQSPSSGFNHIGSPAAGGRGLAFQTSRVYDWLTEPMSSFFHFLWMQTSGLPGRMTLRILPIVCQVFHMQGIFFPTGKMPCPPLKNLHVLWSSGI